VIACEDQLSISGVGYHIACGNAAARLDVPFAAIEDKLGLLAKDLAKAMSFGVGGTNEERVEHPLFDDGYAWAASSVADYRQKAAAQLGTVGSGNHHVNLLRDQDGMVWVGVHFGSRGLGHTSATKYLKQAGGRDWMNVPPALVDVDTDLGHSYLAAMELAGRYAYAGRDWVVERVRRIIGVPVTHYTHNHHNFAWLEEHGGRKL
jgi:tRNA-splicing ligase RtcB